MIAKTITVEDLKNLVDRKLSVQMPDFKATVSARNLVSYMRKAYPLPSNLDYVTSTDTDTNVFTVSIVNKFENEGKQS